MTSAALLEFDSTISFCASLPASTAGAQAETGHLVPLPKAAKLSSAAAGTLLVEGTINAIPFRSTLESDRRRGRCLRVSPAMQAAAKAAAGEEVSLEITRLGEAQESLLPDDLRAALLADPAALSTWLATTAAARRDWVLWLITTRSAETRQRRIVKACSMLGAGKRRVCCFGGMNWLLKTNGTDCAV